jgi:hypothetical protein
LRVVAVSGTPVAELQQRRELEQTDLSAGAGNYPVSPEDEIAHLEEMLETL